MMKDFYFIKLCVLSLAKFRFIGIVLSAILALGFTAQAQNFWGSGSRDLYLKTVQFPTDVTGKIPGRAWMVSMDCTNCAFNPFDTFGRQMVYVKKGETIYIGSSVQTQNNAQIRLYPPNGRVTTLVPTPAQSYYSSTTLGRIENVAQETIGPLTASNPGGYAPFTQKATDDEEGIWIVEFYSRRGATAGTAANQDNINLAATADWRAAQNIVAEPTGLSPLIAAWDITVGDEFTPADPTKFKRGRVFTQVFNGSIASGNNGFFGRFYSLTRDGFMYDIRNNGQNGLTFNFFANNKGVINHKVTNPTPSYETIAYTGGYNGFVNRIWDPRGLDSEDGLNITHKLFYALPDPTMPAEASIWDIDNAIPNKRTTWLKNPRGTPELNENDISFIGLEGQHGISGPKGGHIVFQSTIDGRYEIVIPLPGSYTNKILRGNCVLGENKVYWDGTDGSNGIGVAGVRVVTAVTIASIEAKLEGAEIHFPLADVESDYYGMIIELLDNAGNVLAPRVGTVFWDDKTISGGRGTNTTTGTNTLSNDRLNRHSWGVDGNDSGSAFGNDKVVDTWTFIKGEADTYNGINIIVYETDLEVSSVNKTSGPTNYISVGDALTYTVPVLNKGLNSTQVGKPATFFLYVPRGLNINPANVVFNPTGGASIVGVGVFENVTSSLSPLSVYKISINMPANGGGTFTIPVSVNAAIPTQYVNVWGAILRSDDITDPNASYIETSIPNPIDPFQEANGVRKLVSALNLNSNITTNTDFNHLRSSIANPAYPAPNFTNNIKFNNDLQMYADVKVTKTVAPLTGHAINGQVTFSITAENLGESKATNVIVDDLLNSRFTYISHIAPSGTTYNQTTGIWNIGALTKAQVLAPLQIVVTINAAGAYPRNVATIKADEFDTQLANNEDDALVNIGLSADVMITKLGSTTTTANGTAGTATFTLLVKNNGPDDATNVVVSDALTTRYSFTNPATNHAVSAGTATWSGTQNRNISWVIPYLANGATATMVFTVVRNASTGATTDPNIATVVANEPDPAAANNTSQVTPTAVTTPAAVNFVVTKTVNNSTPFIGANVIFTITLLRIGGANPTSISINDLLPSGYTFVSATGDGTYNAGVWSFTGGSINDTNSRTLVITATVKASTGTINEYNNVASITMNRVDSDPTNNIASATVTPIRKETDLKIEKTVNVPTSTVGANVIFTLTANNLGPHDATGVTVTDVLPLGYTFVSNTSPTVGSFVSSTGIWSIGSLANGASATLTITAKINASGPYLNSATITGSETDLVTGNNTSQIGVTTSSLFISNPMIYQRIIR